MIFIRYYIRMALNSLSRASFSDVFKSCAYSTAAVLFLLGLYFGFYRIIAYLDKIAFIGPILIYKLLSLILLTTFIMIIFSSLITSLNTLFFAAEINYLFTLPIKPVKVFIIKAIESAVQASWMSLVVILPFLSAFAKLKGLGFDFFITIGILFLPYVLTASFIGVIFTMVLFGLFPTRRLRDIIFIMLIAAGSGLYLLLRLIQPERLANADAFQHVMQYVMLIQAPTAFYLPSWWLTEIIRSFAVGDWNDFFLFSGLLSACGVFIFIGGIYTGSKFYLISFNRALWNPMRLFDQKYKFYKNGLFKGIKAKELLLFFRSAEQWPQLILLGALVAVYIFSIYRLPIDTVYLKTLISFLNIGFAGFVLAAVTLRFVFPAISIEGRAFWVIKTLPIAIKKYVLDKWSLYLPFIILLGMIIIGLSCILLKQDFMVTLFSLISIIFISSGLVSLSIGYAAMFPRFNAANTARIESSAGGVIFMITSLFYVGAVISLEAMLAQFYFNNKFMQGYNIDNLALWSVLLSLLIIHLTAVFLPLYLGIRRLNGYEILETT